LCVRNGIDLRKKEGERTFLSIISSTNNKKSISSQHTSKAKEFILVERPSKN
jgi:hypothetical protein